VVVVMVLCMNQIPCALVLCHTHGLHSIVHWCCVIHMNSTPLCFDVVSLLCNVSVRITPRVYYSLLLLEYYRYCHQQILNS
jgi:hypothetical protein